MNLHLFDIFSKNNQKSNFTKIRPVGAAFSHAKKTCLQLNHFSKFCERAQKKSAATTITTGKRKGQPPTGRGGPRGSGYVKAPDFLDVRHYKGGRQSAIRTGRLYPRRNPWYSLSEAEPTSGHVVRLGGATEKIPSDTTGNRSRDRPISSAVP